MWATGPSYFKCGPWVTLAALCNGFCFDNLSGIHSLVELLNDEPVGAEHKDGLVSITVAFIRVQITNVGETLLVPEGRGPCWGTRRLVSSSSKKGTSETVAFNAQPGTPVATAQDMCAVEWCGMGQILFRRI